MHAIGSGTGTVYYDTTVWGTARLVTESGRRTYTDTHSRVVLSTNIKLTEWSQW